MLFNSYIFFVFLGIILPIFYILKSKKARNIHLLIASYIFYSYWDWRFCFLLLISTIVDFFVGKTLYNQQRKQIKKILLLISLITNLSILGFFKYFNFFVDSFENLISPIGFNLDFLHLHVILPVGISFYTFQTLSYTIDIYRNKLKPTNNFIDFALFVSFFPQLVAGPIERASNLLPQLSEKLHPTKIQVEEGIQLITVGLFKKVLIGDTCGRFVDNIFGHYQIHTGSDFFFALVLFSIQIYADFSGYSSIARGVAKLLGVEIMINFQQPYLSRNITEFWRRWHISLSSWLKDYLYIPLGGNRKGNVRTYINLMLTMLIGGLWHGASWNFVIWGGLHGLYLAIHKLSIGNKKIKSSNLNFKDFLGYKGFKVMLQILITYILVLITWLFFRSTDFITTKFIIKELLVFNISSYSKLLLQVTIGFIFVTISLDFLQYFTNKHAILLKHKNAYLSWGVNLIIFSITMLYLFQAAPSPFIYFQF